jgi:hypothetical protein
LIRFVLKYLVGFFFFFALSPKSCDVGLVFSFLLSAAFLTVHLNSV